MTPSLLDKWIAALRSGHYLQGRNELRQDYIPPRFCCLGVLCEITPSFEVEGEDGKIICKENQEELSAEFLRHIGLSSAIQAEAIIRNDGLSNFSGNPQTFEQIANWLDEIREEITR